MLHRRYYFSSDAHVLVVLSGYLGDSAGPGEYGKRYCSVIHELSLRRLDFAQFRACEADLSGIQKYPLVQTGTEMCKSLYHSTDCSRYWSPDRTEIQLNPRLG